MDVHMYPMYVHSLRSASLSGGAWRLGNRIHQSISIYPVIISSINMYRL